jgi:hypothetical protein
MGFLGVYLRLLLALLFLQDLSEDVEVGFIEEDAHLAEIFRLQAVKLMLFLVQPDHHVFESSWIALLDGMAKALPVDDEQ